MPASPTQILQITPCEDWFFVCSPSDGGEVVERVAAWALRADGTVVGLVNNFRNQAPGSTAELVPASANDDDEPGQYTHLNDLTIGERVTAGLAASRKP